MAGQQRLPCALPTTLKDEPIKIPGRRNFHPIPSVLVGFVCPWDEAAGKFWLRTGLLGKAKERELGGFSAGVGALRSPAIEGNWFCHTVQIQPVPPQPYRSRTCWGSAGKVGKSCLVARAPGCPSMVKSERPGLKHPRTHQKCKKTHWKQ